MGAGVLPITFLKGSIYFLLGKEQNNYWCDFGGKSDYKESTYQTAIREGYEELDGLLGNKQNLDKLVRNNLILICKKERYTSYIFYVKPEILISLPFFFKNNRNFLENELDYKYKIENGYYEKSEIKLFNKNDLLINYKEIRPFYRNIITQLLEIDKNQFDKYI